MRRWPIAVLTAVLVLSGCGEREYVKDKVETTAVDNTKMPADMPPDFDFEVRYGYGEVNKNEINTYDDTITKDLIAKGTVKADLKLTDDEMRGIYAKMSEIDIMGKKQLAPAAASPTVCSRTPYSEDSWTVTIDGKTASMSWSSERCDITDDAQQLLELRQYIHTLVESKHAYQALPEAEGGYD
ncbi:hypothetical protein [Paenibacillus glycinis]|uniref:Uncharacterized protein n=1 Tax=Paenibacillus glycinis TaxID=2697035 RepID=A0ABW9XTL4_9BACL|nr:hypothetical protein [Paenibacillus glycinis]NBD25818.1 hypothetical protein [Paenibacillus glycinis]